MIEPPNGTFITSVFFCTNMKCNKLPKSPLPTFQTILTYILNHHHLFFFYFSFFTLLFFHSSTTQSYYRCSSISSSFSPKIVKWQPTQPFCLFSTSHSFNNSTTRFLTHDSHIVMYNTTAIIWPYVTMPTCPADPPCALGAVQYIITIINLSKPSTPS